MKTLPKLYIKTITSIHSAYIESYCINSSSMSQKESNEQKDKKSKVKSTISKGI